MTTIPACRVAGSVDVLIGAVNCVMTTYQRLGGGMMSPSQAIDGAHGKPLIDPARIGRLWMFLCISSGAHDFGPSGRGAALNEVAACLYCQTRGTGWVT